MIGDLKIFIKKVIKQHITCEHKYKYVVDKVFLRFDHCECVYCGKTRRFM